MELLSYVSQLSRRKETLIERAQELKSEHNSIKEMEKEMAKRNAALVDVSVKTGFGFLSFNGLLRTKLSLLLLQRQCLVVRRTP